MKNINELSVVLPTLNEAENLKVLIPDIANSLESIQIDNYEIIVVDDNSSDNTAYVMKNIMKKNKNIKFVIRKSENSLPKSIWNGIDESQYLYVMWLDADGSMSGSIVKELVNKLESNKDSVVIASRFVEGGGYKGTLLNEKKSFFRSMLNVNKSKDSVTETILSSMFNKLLHSLSVSPVKDMTSGFIVGRKKYFIKGVFDISNYGEYFVYLMNYLEKNNISILEVGYVCGTRLNGVSKTGNSFLQLIKLGYPYLKAARMSNRINYENL